MMKQTAWHVVAAALAAIAAAAPPALAAGAEAPSVAVIDTDFGSDAGTWKAVPADERITGSLPAGWADNSSWAKVWVKYAQAADGGRRFLRVQVPRVEEGRPQLQHLIPDLAGPTFFRLTLTARSTTDSAVEVGIRMVGSPYDFLWRTDLALAGEWRDFAFEFSLARNAQPVGLWINQGGAGSIDLAKVRLVRMTREGLIAELKARAPEGGPRNLLRITRMPLGIQSGWSIDRDSSDGDDVQIAADEKVIGPSGSPALAVRSDERVVLHTAPFAVPLAFEPHTASFYARGKAAGRVTVVGEGGWRGSKDFRVDGDDWQRIELKFSPVLLARFHGLRIESTGSLWIDALQVERGAKAGPYESPAACEVALAVESSARVSFDDEPAVVRYAVTGKPPAGAVLKLSAVNAYGDRAVLAEVKLGDQFLTPGQARYDRFAEHPYGVCRIEALVVDAAGRPAGTPNELVVYRLRRPRYWMKDAPNSPFGTHTNSTTRHILMAKAAGVNWTRLHDAGTPYIGWYHLEPAKGKWLFRDKELQRFRRLGMKVLGAFSTAPRWASYFQNEKPHNGYFDRFYQPVRMEDFAHYVRTVAARYKGVIDDWDVWNEPWIHAWWGVDYDESKKDRAGYLTSEHAQADFARLMATAYASAKAVNPRATVLGVNSTAGGTGGEGSFGGTEWTAGVIEAGGLDHCDVVCYHQYTAADLGYVGDATTVGYQDATGPIVAKLGRVPKPVWMSEGSPLGASVGEGFYRCTLPYPVAEDPFAGADRLSRYVVSVLAQGAAKVFLYSMHGHTYFGPNQWRVLVTPEGYLHPSAAGHSAMAWLLEDTRFVKAVAVTEGVTAYLFAGPERSVAVLSPRPNHAAWTLPADKDVHALDLFGNPLKPGVPLGRHVAYLWTTGKVEVLERLLAPSGGG